MTFGSFIPKRNSDRRAPVPTPPSSPVDATEAQPGWSAMVHADPGLHAHSDGSGYDPRCCDRQIKPVTQPPAVEYPSDMSRDGFRHSSGNPSVPQRPNNDETAVFPKIAKPEPGYFKTPEPDQTTILNATPPNIHYATPQPQPQPQPRRIARSLRYRGPNGGIIPIVGAQIHNVTRIGVIITENGYNPPARTLIPWHLVVAFDYDPQDALAHKIENM